MRSWILGLLALFFMGLGPTALASSTLLPDQLTLYGGQAKVHSVEKPLRRVAVGSGEIIEVRNLGGRELVIIGNAAGATSLHVWFQDGTQREVGVRVMAGNLEQIVATVRQVLGAVEGLEVAAIGDNVIVSGVETTQAIAARIAALQEVYPQILNFAPASAVTMAPMILMDVQIMEFDRNALQDLGIQWDRVIDGPIGGVVKDFATNPWFTVIREDSPLEDLVIPGRAGWNTYLGLRTTIGSQINLLKTTGHAFELATPQLAARSGGSAELLVGGEVPIPVASVFGQTQVEFKPYGIRLNIEPVVNASGEISASVDTEISRIDPTVIVEGIPGFLTRRARAELNVNEGETIVISGLVDTTAAKSIEGIPGLSDIPLLGRLFRSDRFQSGRTELVIFVTPYVIDANSPRNLELLDQAARLRSEFRETMGRDILE